MYAVMLAGGKQYRVEKDKVIKIEKLSAEEGEKIEFDQVLLVVEGEEVKFGKPYIEKVKVIAEVVGHGRDKKVEIIKFRRRKHHMKHLGHRQYYTKIKILEIEAA